MKKFIELKTDSGEPIIKPIDDILKVHSEDDGKHCSIIWKGYTMRFYYTTSYGEVRKILLGEPK